MKKALSPLNIDKDLYIRMTQMLKVNPELGYKSRTQFVEKTLEEKLDKMDDEAVLKMIKDEGIMGFKEKARNLLKMGMQLEKRHAELSKIMNQNIQELRELKGKDIHTIAKQKRLITKQKHTLEKVYKSTKK